MHLESTPKKAFPASEWMVLGLIFLIGFALRIYPSAGFRGLGFDENLYRNFVIALDQRGLAAYPAICREHIEDQSVPTNITKLPPTRFLYIFSAWAWKRAEFGQAPPLAKSDPRFLAADPALISLHRVACAFSCLLLVLASIIARRMFDRPMQWGVTALMAFSPLMLHMAQHALIDGFFAFFATLCLWLLWENLRQPDRFLWLASLAGALYLLVLTKENAFFVYVALGGLLLVNIWAKFGAFSWKLLIVLLAAPFAAVATLVMLSGGVGPFITIYQLLVSKAANLQYAIQTGDGPWYRYLVDLMLLSPLVLCLAIGGLFTQVGKNRTALYLVVFVVLSYAIMCNIPYAMNLRYATIWDLTLRILAMAQILWLAPAWGRRQNLFTLVAVVALCLYDLHQYVVFFVDGKLYELVTSGLLWCVKILK